MNKMAICQLFLCLQILCSYNGLMNIFIKKTIYFFCLINFIFILFSFIPERNRIVLPIVNPIVQSETNAGNVYVQAANSTKDGTNSKQYNILLLGLDGRRGESRPRC